MGLYKITILERFSFVMEENADFVVHSLQSGDTWETTALKQWAEACRSLKGTVLDIGAYTGIYSLLAAKASDDVSIEAIEPHLPVFYRLRDNVCTNQLQARIKLHNLALSNQTKIDHLNITGTSPLPSGSSIAPHPTKQNVFSIPVIMRTGDSLFHNKNIKLIKMDVERHEYAIICGLQETLKRCKPVCFIEILERSELDKILPLMQSLGYTHVELICEDLKMNVNDHRIYMPKKDRTNYIFRSKKQHHQRMMNKLLKPS